MLYNKLFKIYENHKLVTSRNASFKHINEDFLQLLISFRFKKFNNNLVIVLPNLYDAQKYYDELSTLIGDETVLFYPANSVLTTLMSLNSPEFKNERVLTLRKILENNNSYIVVTTLDAMLQRQLTKEDYLNSSLTIKKGNTYNLNELKRKLLFDGYQHNYTVERPGEFSVRGSILDIFTFQSQNPIRIDFFDDEVETIKFFDVLTQRSIAGINDFTLIPLSELYYTDSQKEIALNKINEYFNRFNLSEKEEAKLREDLINLEERKKLDTLITYIPFFNEKITTLIDFMDDPDIFLVEPHKMFINEETIKEDLNAYELSLGGNAFTSIPFRKSFIDIYNIANIKVELFVSEDLTYENLEVFKIESFEQDLLNLKYYLKEYSNYQTFISISSIINKEKLKQFFNNEKIDFKEDVNENGKLYIVGNNINGSFLDKTNKVILLSEGIIFQTKRKVKIRYRSVLNQAVKIKDRNELTNGDFVVHYTYGIGRYKGLKTMDLSGVKRDYLEIEYSNNEKMFVPTDQIDLVLKYRNYDEKAPKLSSLSSKTFSNAKANIRKRIKEFSDKLIKLYAARNTVKGFKFSKDNELQENFEADFEFTETSDQLKAINDVKEDMEKDLPMDRLIAGDVGYGKTEVALRAAFKAVLDGKQVAYIAPTTVLARQHYYTFKERFEKYGGNVALLSRFVSRKQQTETINKLKKGLIDIVIGTHRLLSSDISFYDLGLFIIDEEQRFGVMHKEKIKELKVNVDTLTLSATPIPRTLQMAIYGLKDLSMIETPPLNRYPVQTYVTPRVGSLIKEAIDRELARGGQVFYLYNRVTSMPRVVRELKKLNPYAKIGYAHGKMNKEELEKVLEAFINKEYDILVSTTIIETGVDIPNTNTLIIHDADKLGLAQIYQLRGRVGRSDRIAYAYLMYDSNIPLSETSKKRLKTIEDFTDLGSGFKIALEDLSIRGAGDLLGEEQSGYIDSIGIDLYMKLLDEVIKGKSIEEEYNKETGEVFVSRYIPTSYIEYDPVRIEIHKRIANLDSMIDIEDFKLELIDRFGNIDMDVLTYMYEKLYKRLAYKMGIKKTINEGDLIKMIIPNDDTNFIDGIALLESISVNNLDVEIKDSKWQLEIIMNYKDYKEHWLYLASMLLEKYFKIKERKNE